LRETAGFTEQEVEFMLELQILDDLLLCMGFDVGPNTPPDQLKDLLLQYQLENCGNRQLEVVIPNIDLNLVETRELVKLLKARGITPKETTKRKEVEAAVKKSAGGNNLTVTEAKMMSRKTLSGQLEKRGLKFAKTDNKAKLIEKLTG
jgi:hypothetical protein